ncbi:predicted protein [Pyrenophora tritici-repentis Pt-1C-BFP]|uniref:Uncharacterized protein n=1 Tax=Pyrenophora tritici-repentis (strain Pt-1C-BFP) TaxID=426418 RepID=B2WIS5_PYRTR|nr:uncharacterized protein PTRG_09884 [Pyrenophora tritici-repentis Pt-1C-BFP]EDU42935.1 predicted protein [Pyrenophora tritici-repentis Pt-1C-BFP]
MLPISAPNDNSAREVRGDWKSRLDATTDWYARCWDGNGTKVLSGKESGDVGRFEEGPSQQGRPGGAAPSDSEERAREKDGGRRRAATWKKEGKKGVWYEASKEHDRICNKSVTGGQVQGLHTTTRSSRPGMDRILGTQDTSSSAVLYVIMSATIPRLPHPGHVGVVVTSRHVQGERWTEDARSAGGADEDPVGAQRRLGRDWP